MIKGCITTPTAAATPKRRAVLRGLPGPAARGTLRDRRDQDRPRDPGVHTFYRLDDGSFLAFFEAPDMPFEFKDQHDFDLHIALEVDAEALQRCSQGRGAGIEARRLRPRLHRLDLLPRSERLRGGADRQAADHDAMMDPAKNRARAILDGVAGVSAQHDRARGYPATPGTWSTA